MSRWLLRPIRALAWLWGSLCTMACAGNAPAPKQLSEGSPEQPVDIPLIENVVCKRSSPLTRQAGRALPESSVSQAWALLETGRRVGCWPGLFYLIGALGGADDIRRMRRFLGSAPTVHPDEDRPYSRAFRMARLVHMSYGIGLMVGLSDDPEVHEIGLDFLFDCARRPTFWTEGVRQVAPAFDRSEAVRFQGGCISAMGRTNDARARAFLTEMLDDPSAPDRFRYDAARALERLDEVGGHPSYLDDLLGERGSPDTGAR